MKRDAASARWQQLKKSREIERKDAIAKGLIWDHESKGINLKDAVTRKGTCEDMCPEFERAERIMEGDIWGPEKDPETGELDEKRMVKKFRRSAAGQGEALPSELRPPGVLQLTMDFLINDVVANAKWLGDVAIFVWDRSRMIRTDFTVQIPKSVHDVRIAVETYEKIVRFHIASMHHCTAYGKTAPPNYSWQQDFEQLRNSLKSLTQYYDDKRHIWRSPKEAEMRSYMAIFSLQEAAQTLENDIQATWPLNLLNSFEVRSSLELINAAGDIARRHGPLKPSLFPVVQANWERFWRLIRSDRISYLQACAAEVCFNIVRNNVLTALFNGYSEGDIKAKDWYLDQLVCALGFDTEDQVEEYCAMYGFQFDTRPDNGKKCINLGKHPRRTKALPPPKSNTTVKLQVMSRWLEPKRRGRNLAAIIQGMSIAEARAANLIDDDEEITIHPNEIHPKESDSLFVNDESVEEQEIDSRLINDESVEEQESPEPPRMPTPDLPSNDLSSIFESEVPHLPSNDMSSIIEAEVPKPQLPSNDMSSFIEVPKPHLPSNDIPSIFEAEIPKPHLPSNDTPSIFEAEIPKPHLPSNDTSSIIEAEVPKPHPLSNDISSIFEAEVPTPHLPRNDTTWIIESEAQKRAVPVAPNLGLLRDQKRSEVFESLATQLMQEPETGLLAQMIDCLANDTILSCMRDFKEEKLREEADEFRRKKLIYKYCAHWYRVMRRRKGRERRQKRREMRKIQTRMLEERSASIDREEGRAKARIRGSELFSPSAKKILNQHNGNSIMTETTALNQSAPASLETTKPTSTASELFGVPARKNLGLSPNSRAPINTTESSYFNTLALKDENKIVDSGMNRLNRKRRRKAEDEAIQDKPRVSMDTTTAAIDPRDADLLARAARVKADFLSSLFPSPQTRRHSIARSQTPTVRT